MELLRGVNLRHTPGGIPVVSTHYSADPDRDPAVNPGWKQSERKKYSTQGGWDKEQEIIHEAGGGERIFAEILTQYGEQIFIDPDETDWEYDPGWKIINGFDHGKTNPTGALIARVDYEGVIICTGEYYQPGLSPKQHRPYLMSLDGFMQGRTFADPSIFYKTQAQPDGSFKAINDLYKDEGIKHMVPAPHRAEITGMERILQHWLNLSEREPTLKIVCPRHLRSLSVPSYGVHNEGCPNLIWELMRARRAELSASQMLTHNVSEAIVDKDNHLRDDLKYITGALPAPTQKSQELQIKETLAKIADPTVRAVKHLQMQKEFRKAATPVTMAPDWRRRLEGE